MTIYLGKKVRNEVKRIMSIFALSERTKKSIADSVGMPFDKICDLSLEEELAIASKKFGRKIIFLRKRDNRRIGRGSPYILDSRRLITMMAAEFQGREKSVTA